MNSENIGARDAAGRYAHSHEKVCKCGRTKGAHTAEAPFSQEDTSDGLPECPKFSKA